MAKTITPRGCQPWVKGTSGRWLAEGETTYEWLGKDATHEEIISDYQLTDYRGGYINTQGGKTLWNGMDAENPDDPLDWLFESSTEDFQILEHKGKEHRDEQQESLHSRRPVVFEPETNRLHVGDYGWHHTGIFKADKDLDEDEYDYDGYRDLQFGWLQHKGAGRHELGWYPHSQMKKHKLEPIRSALAEHLGQDIQHEDKDQDWTFARVKTLDEYTAAAKLPPVADFSQIDVAHPEYAEKTWAAVNKGWVPGKEGKAIFDPQGELWTWVQWNDWGDPHHHDVHALLEHLGMKPGPNTYQIDAIYEDGSYESFNNKPELAQEVQRRDPRLKPMEEGMEQPWKFGAAKWEDANILDLVEKGWKPGTQGKAIKTRDRTYSWTPDRWGEPHHAQVFQAIPGVVPETLLDISPDGKMSTWEDQYADEPDDWEFS